MNSSYIKMLGQAMIGEHISFGAFNNVTIV